ncbi:MAG: hypothetical protein GC205_07685 [Bacteroidetes bacterium]|nr:hypothetical protein [Bacteroidota bacterium]
MAWVLLFGACERTLERDVIVDNLIYGIDTIPVYSTSAEKDKLKTTTQFVSTAYSQLYLRPIPSGTLNDLALLRSSHGDKNLIGELVISHFLADNAVLATLPSDAEMNTDPEAFVELTYLRFFLRLPTAYERYALSRQIVSDPETTVVEVYRAFLLSNEYLYY